MVGYYSDNTLYGQKDKKKRAKLQHLKTNSKDPELSAEQWKPEPLKKRKASENLHFSMSKKFQNSDNNSSDNTILDTMNIHKVINDNILPDNSFRSNNTNNDTGHDNSSPNDEDINCSDVSQKSDEIDEPTYYDDLRQRFFRSNFKYPSNFDDATIIINIAGANLYYKQLQTLQPKVWLDGDILNTFFIILESIGRNKNFSVMRFDTYIITAMLNGTYKGDFLRWEKKIQTGRL